MPASLRCRLGEPARRAGRRPARLRANGLEPDARVELTASFLRCLAAIEAFLTAADAQPSPSTRCSTNCAAPSFLNLRRFPRIGRRYLDQPPQSAEALSQLVAAAGRCGRSAARVPARRLPDPVHRGYAGAAAHLLSIRHHRELSFQFSSVRAGSTGRPWSADEHGRPT